MLDYKTIKENPLGTRPDWDEYFMKIAIDVASRASCSYVRSGSVFVNSKHELRATGYNGASGRRKSNCLEIGCQKQGKYEDTLDSGDCVGIHSEMNGLGHLIKISGEELHLYTTILPCPDCAKNLEPYNVAKVVFKKPYSKKETQKSLRKFDEANIDVYRLDLNPKRYLDITFNEPDTLTHSIWTPEERKIVTDLDFFKNQ